MSAWALDWLHLVIRWTHVVTGIAWIGASFYFNWLEGRLDRGGDKSGRIAGDLWSVHGGGFYHLQKYEVAPATLPETLHWFKWEAYATWLSGFALLLLIYYLDPQLRLLGSNPLGLSTTTAVVLGLGSLVAGWGLYDALCRSRLVRRPVAFAAVGLAAGTAVAWLLTTVLEPRGAFLHFGAMIGTIMAANVFFVIIPAQKTLVAAMARGESPDPVPGRDALDRSLHNNYLTLPVVFVMISPHFPATFGHRWNWAVLAVLAVGSATVRHWFNLRNRGDRNTWIFPVAAALLVGLAWLTRPAPPAGGGGDAPPYWQVRAVIDGHCLSCHSAWPSDPAFPAAPLGLVLDTPAQVQAAAGGIHARAVVAEDMPLGNASGMTGEERALLGRWVEAGAPLE